MERYTLKLNEKLKEVTNLDPTVKYLFTSLLECYIDEWKERLVDLKGDERDEMQGAIKRVRGEILSALSRKSASIREKQEKFVDGGYNA
jgi:hypothetical protein